MLTISRHGELQVVWVLVHHPPDEVQLLYGELYRVEELRLARYICCPELTQKTLTSILLYNVDSNFSDE